MKTLSAQLREAIRASGFSRYAISLRTGIPQSSLSYFIKGERNISLESADKLMRLLGLEITKRKEG
jgi:hypothetical protein